MGKECLTVCMNLPYLTIWTLYAIVTCQGLTERGTEINFDVRETAEMLNFFLQGPVKLLWAKYADNRFLLISSNCVLGEGVSFTLMRVS